MTQVAHAHYLQHDTTIQHCEVECNNDYQYDDAQCCAISCVVNYR